MWQRTLRNNPELAEAIARQRFGLPAPKQSDNSDEEYEAGDLLGVLKQAREAKELLADELQSSGKKSWLSNLSQILQAVPGTIQSMQQLAQQQQGQQQPQQRQYLTGGQQPQQRPPQQGYTASPEEGTGFYEEETEEQPPQPQEVSGRISLEDISSLLNVSPGEAVTALRQSAPQWLQHLKGQSHEEIIQQIGILASQPGYENAKPLYEHLNTEEGREWLRKVVQIASAEG